MLNRQEFFNRVTLLDFALQWVAFILLLQDATNNDLMNALQKQNHEYFETIIEQNNRIISILSQFDDMSAK